jgi:Rrf2 family protein
MGVPRTYVSQILGDLVRAEVAVSSAGLHGGYRLARPPAKISLLEVVEAGEGSLVPECCPLGEGPSRWEDVCPLHDAWARASRALRAELSATTLAELAAVDRSIEAGAHPVPADALRHRVAAMAVADSVHIELPAAAVAARLQEGGSWLAPHVAAANADGEAIRLRVGPGGPAWLGKTVAVRLSRPDRTGDALRVAIAWEATGASALFPRFEGTLGITDLDPERCELSLSGHYRPPLGRAGHALDDALLGRVARATVRSLLRRVAHGLEQASTTTVVHEPVSGPEPAGATG